MLKLLECVSYSHMGSSSRSVLGISSFSLLV